MAANSYHHTQCHNFSVNKFSKLSQGRSYPLNNKNRRYFNMEKLTITLGFLTIFCSKVLRCCQTQLYLTKKYVTGSFFLSLQHFEQYLPLEDHNFLIYSSVTICVVFSFMTEAPIFAQKTYDFSIWGQKLCLYNSLHN